MRLAAFAIILLSSLGSLLAQVGAPTSSPRKMRVEATAEVNASGAAKETLAVTVRFKHEHSSGLLFPMTDGQFQYVRFQSNTRGIWRDVPTTPGHILGVGLQTSMLFVPAGEQVVRTIELSSKAFQFDSQRHYRLVIDGKTSLPNNAPVLSALPVEIVTTDFLLPKFSRNAEKERHSPRVTQYPPRKPLQISEEQSMNFLVHKVKPNYSALARRKHVSGIVVLDVIVDGKYGHVKQVKAISGPSELIAAAKHAAKQYAYDFFGSTKMYQTQITIRFRQDER